MNLGFFFPLSGILVPGGFGGRGVEGKILAAHWARTRNIPYLGEDNIAFLCKMTFYILY